MPWRDTAPPVRRAVTAPPGPPLGATPLRERLPMSTLTLSPADLASYHTRGYWISPVLYSAAEIADLRAAVIAVCRGERANGTRYWLGDGPPATPPAGQENRVVQVCNAWWVNARLRQAATDPRLGAIGAQLMATPQVRLWHDQAIVKPGAGPDARQETGGNVGWHQDYAHWQCASTPNFCTAWIALQDTNLQNGGMRTIVGSHRWGLQGDAYTFGEQDLQALEQRFRRPDQPWQDEPCILQAGQVSFHHALTFHGSGPNLTHQPRLCFIAHLMPADCALNDRGRYHPNLDLLGPAKRVGDLFAGPCFPRLWPPAE